MSAYYNEIDPYAAQWLRNLIAAGHIAPGEVDERSIVDVRPADLAGFNQCHFFAGIGGWSYAARLAGWPDDRPLWTGSCPCQPFSVAGKGEGQDDARHLWPELFRLVEAVRPPVLMGEQVAAAVGKDWLDGVCADLEGIGYACGAAVVPACAVDAPHRRDRLWFVADAERSRVQDDRSGIADRTAGTVQGDRQEWERLRPDAWERCDAGSLANTDDRKRHWWSGPMQVGRNAIEGSASWGGRSGRAQWRIKPGLPLLAHGVPARVGRLRAYGNAIVPQVAAEVIAAFMEAA